MKSTLANIRDNSINQQVKQQKMIYSWIAAFLWFELCVATLIHSDNELLVSEFLEGEIEREWRGDKFEFSRVKFHAWQRVHGKEYENEQIRRYRESIYIATLNSINYHNEQEYFGFQTYTRATNRYSDLTDQQFQHLRTNHFQKKNHFQMTQSEPNIVTTTCKGAIMDAPNPPESLDWAEPGSSKVNPAEDQGSCGCAYSIVAVGAVESLYRIKEGSLPKLSTQQVNDCSSEYGNEGCYGGFMDQAFWYVIDYGIASDSDYPYTMGKTSDCKYTINMKYTRFIKCAKVPEGIYHKLLSAIVQQPVSVSISYNKEMSEYKKGVFNGQCSNQINHGMLLVGYGQEYQHETNTTIKFWKLRNTEGVTHGDNGFIKIERTEADGPGKCGIQLWASVPQQLG